MDHVHLHDSKENDQVSEAADDSLNTSVNESLWIFKQKTLNTFEIIRDKKKKRLDIDTIHDYIMKTEASNADKTLIEILFKNLIKQNILINKKTTQGLHSFEILKNVDQTSQTSSDQILPNLSQIKNATKTPDTEDKNFTRFTTIIERYSRSIYENLTNNFLFKFYSRIILFVKS